VSPRSWHRLNRFRHFIDGSLALASLNLACRNLVPAFPHRGFCPQQLAVACGQNPTAGLEGASFIIFRTVAHRRVDGRCS
jgi:hypothetical protein